MFDQPQDHRAPAARRPWKCTRTPAQNAGAGSSTGGGPSRKPAGTMSAARRALEDHQDTHWHCAHSLALRWRAAPVQVCTAHACHASAVGAHTVPTQHLRSGQVCPFGSARASVPRTAHRPGARAVSAPGSSTAGGGGGRAIPGRGLHISMPLARWKVPSRVPGQLWRIMAERESESLRSGTDDRQ